MKFILMTLLLMGAGFSASAFASPCAKSGWTGLRANDGSGFIFYVYRDAPDIYFLVTGKEISFPDKSITPPRFFIDGVFYQTLLVKPSQFMKFEKDVGDLEILQQHQKYEWEFMQKTPTPLRKLDVLGARVRPASNGKPGFTFYLWAAEDPKDAQGSRQYFLTTVSSGEVFVLSAMVANQTQADLAFEVFESYISHFQHVLDKKIVPTNCELKQPKQEDVVFLGAFTVSSVPPGRSFDEENSLSLRVSRKCRTLTTTSY